MIDLPDLKQIGILHEVKLSCHIRYTCKIKHNYDWISDILFICTTDGKITDILIPLITVDVKNLKEKWIYTGNNSNNTNDVEKLQKKLNFVQHSFRIIKEQDIKDKDFLLLYNCKDRNEL